MNGSTRRMGWSVCVAGLLWVFVGSAAGAEAEIKLAVTVATPGGKDVPVCVKIDVPAGLAKRAVGSFMEMQRQAAEGLKSGEEAMGRLVTVSRGKQAELWWVLPEAKPATTRWTARLSAKPHAGKDVFAFRDAPGKCLDLTFAGRLVTRYMYEFDTSTKAKTFETYKPYHHVFDAAGKDVITKGAAGHDPHHRGIYIGWGRLVCGKKRYDFWGMRGGAQVHKKFLRQDAGPVVARSTALIDWQDKEGKVLVSEERETLCFRQGASAILLMEFRSRLKAVGGDVALDGNAEHAGVQYRPHNDVAVQVGAARGKQTADTAKADLKTRYEFHKDGVKTPQQRLKENKDLPWAAQSYALRGKRYSVQHMNHRSNPKGTIYSAYRQYGRFGAFFKAEIKAGETLTRCDRIYVAESEMPPRAEMNLRHAAFNAPPKVAVVK